MLRPPLWMAQLDEGDPLPLPVFPFSIPSSSQMKEQTTKNKRNKRNKNRHNSAQLAGELPQRIQLDIYTCLHLPTFQPVPRPTTFPSSRCSALHLLHRKCPSLGPPVLESLSG
jgi:hypothetical protein